MKRSELKEAIKAEIKSVLSEDIKVGDMVTIGDGKRKYEVINVEKGFMSDIDDVEVKSMDGMPIGSSNPDVGSKTATYKATQLRLAEEDLNEVYQTNSKMKQMVSLFQDMMADEYDGILVPDAFKDFIPKFFEAVNKDYESAENFGEKVSNIREAKSAADVDKEVKAKKAEMVEKAKEYKAAEGEKKEKIKDQLKKMTAERDELEKKVKDLKKKEEKEAEDIGRGQELKV